MMWKQTKIIDRAILLIATLSLIFSPWAYGTVEPWSLLIFESGAAIILFLWGMQLTIEDTDKFIPPFAAIIAIGFLLLILIQLLPGLGTGSNATISLAPQATWLSLLKTSALVIYFCALIQIASQPHSRTVLIYTIVVVGLALSVFAIVQYATWNGRVYWWHELNNSAECFGPFINRNHFAGYVAMTLSLSLGMLIYNRGNYQERFFFALASAVMALAIVLSHSRGGLVSALAGVLSLSVLCFRLHINSDANTERVSYLRNRLVSGSSLSIALVFIIALVLLIAPGQTGLAALIDMKAGISSINDRWAIWRDAWTLFQQHPLLGVGLGAYPYVSTMTVDKQLATHLGVHQTHNDYLQTLTDTGIVGGIFAILFLSSIFIAVRKNLRSVRVQEKAIILGAGSGIIALLVHSSVDFNLQLASNALLFLALTALAIQPSDAQMPGGKME
ncbi:MAG: O-antigen ligase family protein [Acidobacteriota bacterium]